MLPVIEIPSTFLSICSCHLFTEILVNESLFNRQTSVLKDYISKEYNYFYKHNATRSAYKHNREQVTHLFNAKFKKQIK